MNIDQYAEWVNERWLGNNPLELRDHYIMNVGLAEEAGEVLGLLKKWIRDGKLDKNNLKKELGDVFYYLVRICTAHEMKPSEVLLANVEKIDDRLMRGVIHGSGDDR
jgi:NTP pyrophosphatase (non-canonical NTP hydrolase)